MWRLILMVMLASVLGCAGIAAKPVPAEGYRVRVFLANGPGGKAKAVHDGYNAFAEYGAEVVDGEVIGVRGSGWGTIDSHGPSLGGGACLLDDGRLHVDFEVESGHQLELELNLSPFDPPRAVAGKTKGGDVYVLLAVPGPEKVNPAAIRREDLAITFTAIDLKNPETTLTRPETVPISDFPLENLEPGHTIGIILTLFLVAAPLDDVVELDADGGIVELPEPDWASDASCELSVDADELGIITAEVTTSLGERKMETSGELPIKEGETLFLLLPRGKDARFVWVFAIAREAQPRRVSEDPSSGVER